MAILEIARIQVRRGQENITGLPQLESGEFGWAIDTQQLYIGNGTIAEGAPMVGNTRILTEHDNLFNLNTSSYVYKASQREPGLVTESVPRTLQEKLDDFVTVYDFGATGDGYASTTTYSAQALQTAIDEIFLNSDKADPISRTALRLPAGVFNIDQTVYVPPYTTLIGDGQGKTVLKLASASTATIQFCDQTSVAGSYVVMPNLQSLTSPAHINLIGLTFEYDSNIAHTDFTQPLVKADAAVDSYFIDCKFTGNYETGTAAAANTEYAGIDLRGQNAITIKDLIIVNCQFEGLYYGIKSNYDIDDVVITQSKFINLNRGICYAESLEFGNTIGPVRTKLHDNKFVEIEREAFYVGANTNNTPTYHASSYNTFEEVGNDLAGDYYPSTAIINYLTLGNNSANDRFIRFEEINSTSTSINFIQSVSGKTFVDDTTVRTATIPLASDALIKFPHNNADQKYKIQYSSFWTNQGINRVGELTVNVASMLAAPYTTATVTDSFTYSGVDDGGLQFTTSLNTVTNTVQLNFVAVRPNGVISYKYSQLQ